MKKSDENLEIPGSRNVASTGPTIEQLKLKNDQLNQQIETLRKQLNESFEFAQQNEILIKQNTELTAKLRSTEASADDMQKRLEITMKTNEELQNLLENMKQQKAKEENQKETTEMNKMKLNFADQIQKLNKQLETNEDLLKKSNSDIGTLRNSINSVISAAGQAFQRTFENVDELSDFLLQQSSATTTQISQMENDTTEIINTFKKELLKKQERLKEERSIRKALEAKYSDLKGQYNDDKQALEQKIAKLEIEILDNVKETQQIKSENEHKLKMKDDEIQLLKDKIDSLKSQIPTEAENRTNNENSYNLCKLKQENEELQAKIDALMNDISEHEGNSSNIQKQALSLTSQLKSLEISYDSLKKKHQLLMNDLQEKTKELDKLKVENSALLLEKSSAEESLKANLIKLKNSDLQNQKLQSILDENNNKQQKLLNTIDALQNQTQSQQNEMKQMISNRDRLISILKHSGDMLKSLETSITQLTAQNKAFKKQIKNTEKRLAQELEKSQDAFDIQPSVFYTDDFPRDLCTKIAEFATNIKIPASSKIKSAISLISKYYNDIIQEKSNEIKFLSESQEKREITLDKFLSQIGSLFEASFLSCETIINDPVSAYEVTNKANKLFVDHIDISNAKTRIEEDLLAMLTKLEVNNTTDGEKMINDLFAKINDLKSELNNERNKLKDFKKILKQVNTESNSIASSLRKNLTDRDREILSLKEDISRQQTDIRKYNNEINQLKEENNQIKENSEKLKLDFEKIKGSMKIKYDSQVENVTKQVQLKLDAKENAMSEMKSKIRNLEKECSELRRTVQMMRDARTEHDKQQQFIIDQCDNNVKEIKLQCEREKDMIKNQYDKYINEIKEKNNELAKSHSEVVVNLQESENKLLQINAKLAETSKQCDNLMQKNESYAEEIERIKRVMEMKERSNILATEMKFETMLEEQRSSFFTEKRNLIGYVVQQFRQYFDAQRELDDDCLRDVISQAKRDLESLMAQENAAKKVLKMNSIVC